MQLSIELSESLHVSNYMRETNIYLYMYIRSRNSSVGTATGYGMDVRVQFTTGASDFSLLHRVHPGCRAHPASYAMCTVGFPPAVKATPE
jgi:hypothetical protein